MFLQWILLAILGGAPSHGASNSGMGPCDSWFTSTANPKGVVVLTHGMNLRPSCMDELAKSFSSAGYEVFRPAFTGHCGENEKYLNVTAEEWEADARRIYGVAAARAENLKKPIHLVAYSFTALIYQTMEKELPFDRRVYLAPPLATKFWYPAVSWLARTFPWITYESKNTMCGFNVKSGARPLLALEVFLQRWRDGAGKNYSGPVLVFAEPDDELVSYGGLVTFVADKNNWSMERVSNAGHTMPETYHHLIVDSPTLGKEEFSRMLGLAKDFLNAPGQ